MIYYIQAAATGGWTLYRGMGMVKQHYRSLTVAKMLMQDTGAKLVVLDKNGFPMEADY